MLSSIGSFGSSSNALGSKFAILSCDVDIDEKVLDEPTMPHFVRVDVNALYGFKPRESVITVRATAENKTGEPLV